MSHLGTICSWPSPRRRPGYFASLGLLGLLLLGACPVSRQQHAATLRELELTKGRLSDAQKKIDQQEQKERSERAQLEKDLKDAQGRAISEEAKAKALETRAAQAEASLVACGASSDAKEKLLVSWSEIYQGSLSASGIDPSNSFASASLIEAKDSTGKATFVTSLSGITLSTPTLEALKTISSKLKDANRGILVIGFADGSADDLKTSSQYAISVAKALSSGGVPGELIRVSAAGATQKRCTTTKEPKCIEQNNRVMIVLLPQGV